MSYEIIYDKQLVRIPKEGENDKFIPLIYAGSSNCYETNGRRARDWFNFQFLCPVGKLIATKEEMLSRVAEWRQDLIDRNEETNKRYKEEGNENWIDVYSDNNFGFYAALAIGGSTRNTTYGNVKGIVTTGVKKALTVEQLAEENIYVTVETGYYAESKLEGLGLESFCTTVYNTEELIDILEKAQEYYDKGVSINISINANENKMKWLRKFYFPRKRKVKTLIEVDSFFTVKMPNDGYLVKRTRNGYRFTSYPYLKYKTEGEAQRRAKSSGGVVEHINKSTTLNV